MADSRVTALTELTTVDKDDILYVVDDPGGTPAGKKVTVTNLSSLLAPQICQGRLTLTTATPVTTANVTAATTLYFTPYKGNKLAIYDGSKWDVFTFTELSLSLSGYTASKPYDIWVYDNSGTVTLDSTIWTDGSNRATALAFQDGVYVKSGDATRRYLGTIYINSTGGQTDDTEGKRFVWNYYNRVFKGFNVNDNTTHTYATNTFRSWNNDDNVRGEMVLGVLEDTIHITVSGQCHTNARLSYGINSTSVSANLTGGLAINTTSYVAGSTNQATIADNAPGLGYNYIQIIEKTLSGTGNFATAILSSIIPG